MKKYVTIGRDVRCDITLSDPTDQTSRNHALLEVDNWGRYHITDRSTNGTYINGMKIPFGEPVKVSRKDTVSFAHVADLDWALVPKNNLRCYLVAAVVAVCVIVAGLLIWDGRQETMSFGNVSGQSSGVAGGVIVGKPSDEKSNPPKVEEEPKEKKKEEKKKTPRIDAIY